MLSAIFMGDVTRWDHPDIAGTNPGRALPAVPIRVIVRDDGSGTTEIFTKALALFSSAFKRRIGQGSPYRDQWCGGSRENCTAGLAVGSRLCSCTDSPRNQSYATGSSSAGVAAMVAATPYSISYLVLGSAARHGLSAASLVNKAGSVVAPNSDSLAFTLMEFSGAFDATSKQGWAADIIDPARERGWPISAYTYFVVRTRSATRDCESRRSMIAFFEWFYTADAIQRIARRLQFAVLPAYVRGMIFDDLLSHVQCRDGSLARPRPTGEELMAVTLAAPPTFLPLISTVLEAYQSIDPTARLSHN